MKICIVTSKHVSYNPRVVKEADALSSAGHDVTVVTVCNNSAQALLDESILATRAWRLFTVKYRKQAIIEKCRWLRLSIRQRLFEKFISRIALGFGIAERAQGREYPELRRLACSVMADLYIAHHVETLGAAYAAARKHRARFAFDAEDFHSGMFNTSGEQVRAENPTEMVRRLLVSAESRPMSQEQNRIKYLERKYLPRCNHRTAASDGIADAYALTYNIPRPTTILNVFPLEKPSVRSGATTDAGFHSSAITPHSLSFRLYWYSQVIGPGRGLEDAVHSLALLKRPCELHLRGTAFPNFVQRLTALAASLGVQDRLFIHPPSPPDNLIREAACYDIGLALENSVELNRLICVTNKIFTYMNAGLAIIATDTPGQQGIMARVPYVGQVCKMNDAVSLAASIDSLTVDPERLATARKASRLAAEERFNWEMEQRKFLEVVRKGTENV